jgi:polyhydroxyalkanoate synthesis repressor PhaR
MAEVNPGSTSAMPPLRLIKKYPNRRLYDTERSTYITVEDIRKLVLDGVDFKVVDDQSGEDVTRAVLIQIIIEHESGSRATFTTDMLARFIRLSNDAARRTFADYLDQSMRMFLEQQKTMGDSVYKAMSGNALAEMAERNMELWRTMQDGFMKATGFAKPTKKGGGRSGGSAK